MKATQLLIKLKLGVQLLCLYYVFCSVGRCLCVSLVFGIIPSKVK